MKTLYLDCFAGICEQRLLGALISAGADETALRAAIAPAALTVQPALRGGIEGILACIAADTSPDDPLAALPDTARQHARAVLDILQSVQITPDTDTVLYIACICLAIDLLGVQEIIASPLQDGVHTHPDVIVLTDRLHVPVRPGDFPQKLITPAGAAIAAHFVSHFGPMPAMDIIAIGYGAGADGLALPDPVRVVLGDTSGSTFDRMLEEIFEKEPMRV